MIQKYIANDGANNAAFALKIGAAPSGQASGPASDQTRGVANGMANGAANKSGSSAVNGAKTVSRTARRRSSVERRDERRNKRHCERSMRCRPGQTVKSRRVDAKDDGERASRGYKLMSTLPAPLRTYFSCPLCPITTQHKVADIKRILRKK